MTDIQPDPDLVQVAAQAYVYGYPLVYNLHEAAKLVGGVAGLVEPAPINAFGSARQLLDPSAAFVSPNNDTLYLVAVCDLGAGPLVLDVPDTDDRYYVLQLIDAWTNNFGYLGRRATGTAAGSFLLAPEDFTGDAGGRPVVRCPSRVFVIVGRIQVDGDDDLPAVHALQDAFRLTPAAGSVAGALPGIPTADARVADALSWWEELRLAVAAFPPPEADEPYLEGLRALGLLSDDAVLVDPDPTLAATLVAGQQQGEELVETLSKTALDIVDGWTSALHVFDYNVDHLALGTIDAPEWKMTDRTKAYVVRAVAARLGLWGNHGYEADYHVLWQDEHGDPLDGSRRYELTLSPPPPVDAFWSLTMYDEPDYYLVANPIDRYSIGDRTPGLRVDEDGSVTILLQHDRPGPDEEANWLPAPSGAFRPILRSYQPQAALLEEGYTFPQLRRLT